MENYGVRPCRNEAQNSPGVLIEDLTISGDASAGTFASRRRRLLLAIGGITLTSAVAPRLLARPAGYGPAHIELRAHNEVPAHSDLRVHNRVPAHRAPSYPFDRPLYYIRDASKAIALTIDDGPDPVYTPQVLRLLREYQVTATFSMVGIHVAAYPRLARAVAEAGHQIANHTWTHANLTGMPLHDVQSQLIRASQAIHAATGAHPGLFRAPYGAWSATVIRQCEQMKMVPVDWSVDPRDWSRPGTRRIVRTIMKLSLIHI